MHQLPAYAIDRVGPLFEAMHYNLAVQAILAGSVPAEIYVDNVDHPRVALTCHGGRVFLAGSPGEDAFSQRLPHLLTELAPASDVFVLYYEPAGAWEETLDHLLSDLDPIRSGREYYALDLPASSEGAAQPALPDGFSLRYVDEELLADETLGNRDDLVEELCSERDSVPDFLEKSFGYCLLHGNDVAGWCLSEYNTGSRCEVGIATFEPHRRQGLATATGSALLGHAASRGITQVGWHCYASNVASAATASKLGFRRRVEYPVRLAYFDATLNHAVHGNIAFQQGEYDQAVTRYKEAMAKGAAPVWVYWNAACASAQLGSRSAALDYLDQAIDRGFDDLERLLSSKHLTGLHDTEGWQDLTRRLQA
mgnify:CR=1 FL=1